MTHWIVSTHSANDRRIHDDRECSAIQDTVATVREAKDHEINRYEPCSFCAGELPDPAHHGPKLSTKLSKMDPDEVSRESVGGTQ